MPAFYARKFMHSLIQLMPSPPKLPVTPALLRTLFFRHSLPFFLRRCVKRYGDLVQLRPGIWLASHPDLVRQILVANPQKWNKARGVEKTKRLMGEGLLGSHGELHRGRRRLLQPLFSVARLPFYADTILDCALETRDRWHDGDRVDIGAEMSVLALSIITRGVFGAGITGRENEISRGLDVSMKSFNLAMMPGGDVWEKIPHVERRFQQGKRAIDDIVYALIEERRRAHLSETDEDVLSILLRARNEDGSGLRDEDIRDEAMTLLMAGHETTANVLTFANWFVGRHPDVRARLETEVDEVLGERRATYADLGNLKYTRAILSETMRLTPPAWMVGRHAVEELTLQWQGQTVEVPNGTTILISPFVLHRDERFWENARSFEPSRWENGFQPPKNVYLPFGAGARTCIAENFAWMEATLSLATLAQKFRAFPIGKLDLEPSATLRSRGPLWMRLESR